MKNKTPTSEEQSTDRGCECIYFSNKDGTGWKVFSYKENAKIAWATQIWAVRKDIAPLVLSGIKEIDIKFENEYRNFYCPISGKYPEYYCPNKQFEILYKEKYIGVNCSNFMKKVKSPKYGFLTEEVPEIANDIDINATSKCYNYFISILNINDFDFHNGNWGILNNRIVFIDFGIHFSRNLSDKIKKEIDKIKGEAA